MGNAKTEEYFSGVTVFFMAANRKNKIDSEWAGPVIIIIGRFGNKYAIVHFRWSYFEADLYDMRSANSLLDIVGCDGTLTLHAPHTKFPIH